MTFLHLINLQIEKLKVSHTNRCYIFKTDLLYFLQFFKCMDLLLLATYVTVNFIYNLYTRVMKLRNVKSNLCPSGFPPFPSTSQPSVLLGEDPPPYSPLTSPESGSAPVISCRVCQSLISVEGKIHQHVVKCGVCNEATVSP